MWFTAGQWAFVSEQIARGNEVGSLAKYSQGASPHEVKQVKKALEALDNRIVLPDSLRGSALLYKLDGIEPDVPAGKRVWELLFPRRPRFRVWAGYAAALVLVVGLFYNIGLNRPLVPGEVSIGDQPGVLVPLLDGGGSIRLGELGEYLLYHQSGVLFLVDAGGQTIISQVETPSLTGVPAFYTVGQVVHLHSANQGQPPDYAYTIDFTDPQNPVVLLR